MGAVSILFFAALVCLTFFSNTIQSITLPKVRAEQPSKEGLSLKLEGSGELKPFHEEKLLNLSGWKVKRLYVEKGDRVKKGQKLITYDNSEAIQELNNEQTNLKKQELELGELEDQFIVSAVTGDELDIKSAKRKIETAKLDIEMQVRKINEMKQRLAGSGGLNAPFEGVVTQVNAVEGMPSSGEPDILIVPLSEGYQFEFSADSTVLSGMNLLQGDSVEINIQANNEKQIRKAQGTIAEISQQGSISSGSPTDETHLIEGGPPQKVVRIKVIDPELRGGEWAWISMEKTSRDKGWLISNGGVHEERFSSFVYKVDIQRGPLGNTYVVRKVNIHDVIHNERETWFQTDNLYNEDLIIVESGEPLQEGDRIRLSTPNTK